MATKRKKPRSAKQKANDRRLGKMAKARSRKSAPKRRRSTTKPKRRSAKRKVNKKKTTKKRMASKGIIGKIPLVNNPIFKKVALGVGTATIGVSVLTLVAPGIANQPLIKPVLAFIGGGIPGVVGQIISQGGIGGIGNILKTNGGSSSMSVSVVGNGFA